MSVVCGVDQGLDGALCFLDSATSTFAVHDMPTLLLKRGGKSKREVDGHALTRIFRSVQPDHVFLEIAGAVPRISPEGKNRKGGQGVSSAFASGEGYGIIRGVLAALDIPYSRVSPQRWKKALAVPAEKDGARARASQLLPSGAHHWPLKKHHGRAESALLMLYGAREIGVPFQKTTSSVAEADLFAEATA